MFSLSNRSFISFPVEFPSCTIKPNLKVSYRRSKTLPQHERPQYHIRARGSLEEHKGFQYESTECHTGEYSVSIFLKGKLRINGAYSRFVSEQARHDLKQNGCKDLCWYNTSLVEGSEGTLNGRVQ